ncbi:hypothetical protein [Kitasatospora sp. CB01950]|uniref:hypothetical protein n=1 Tax=Kitasatospora sp. CB01950 TaxID=1703930 RepID=UPI0009388853|nr:hypothetical protein [Kitasatospora sp. CB01950]OKJ00033.1 hypothetical protein AMK19_30225 [Kitasatospora sp. CB01950]
MTDIESPEPAATEQQPAVETPNVETAAPETAETAGTAGTAEATETAEAPAAKPRRTALKAVAAVVVAALVGVGIGEAIIKVHYKETDAPVAAAPAPSATPTHEFGAKSNGNHFGSLRDLLLPLPSSYHLGPDYKSIGNDNELRDADLDKALKETLADVPEKYRKDAESALSSLHIQGIGARSMVSLGNQTVITLVLSQFNQQAVAAENSSWGKWYTDNELYRVGPGVAGHGEAHCALPTLKAGDQLDYLQCYAGVGDMLVQMEVAGVAPLDQNKVVDLFRQQLDRLAVPGASA